MNKLKMIGITAIAALAITLAPAIGATQSGTAEAARPISCRYVVFPATAPWYKCINLNPTAKPNPYCSPRRVYVCG